MLLLDIPNKIIIILLNNLLPNKNQDYNYQQQAISNPTYQHQQIISPNPNQSTAKPSFVFVFGLLDEHKLKLSTTSLVNYGDIINKCRERWSFVDSCILTTALGSECKREDLIYCDKLYFKESQILKTVMVTFGTTKISLSVPLDAKNSTVLQKCKEKWSLNTCSLYDENGFELELNDKIDTNHVVCK